MQAWGNVLPPMPGSVPYRRALRHDGRDLIIRKMLAESGIEPIEPETTEDENAA